MLVSLEESALQRLYFQDNFSWQLIGHLHSLLRTRQISCFLLSQQSASEYLADQILVSPESSKKDVDLLERVQRRL